MAFKRFGEAVWQGDLQSGKGAMSTPQSGLFADQNYSFKTRFGDEKGTNPEELLAVAHAGLLLDGAVGGPGQVRVHPPSGSRRAPKPRWIRAWTRVRRSPACS